MTRLYAGQRIRSLPTRTWNTLVDFAKNRPDRVGLEALEGAVADLLKGSRPGQVPIEICPNFDLVEHGVAIIDGPTFEPAQLLTASELGSDETLRPPLVDVVAPATANLGGVCVVSLEPIKSGDVGAAVIRGLAWARVDVQNGADTECGPVNADAEKLQSGTGQFTIVWREREGETGDQWCLVMLESASGSVIADMLKGTVDSVIAAGSGTGSTPTNRCFQLKTSSPAPIPLPTGTPTLSGTIYVADPDDRGGAVRAGDIIFAIRRVTVDSYNPGGGAVDVNWEFLPISNGTPFTCVITASLTGATWSDANKRLTPAANTNTAKLLGWDSANSRYDEATDGLTISPEWVSTADVTIDSNKCLIGKGIFFDGRWQLYEIDCPNTEQQDYTTA